MKQQDKWLEVSMLCHQGTYSRDLTRLIQPPKSQGWSDTISSYPIQSWSRSRSFLSTNCCSHSFFLYCLIPWAAHRNEKISIKFWKLPEIIESPFVSPSAEYAWRCQSNEKIRRGKMRKSLLVKTDQPGLACFFGHTKARTFLQKRQQATGRSIRHGTGSFTSLWIQGWYAPVIAICSHNTVDIIYMYESDYSI